jgi:putative transposase
MPRAHRIVVPDWCYHFINRSNERARIFHSSADYEAFIRVLAEAQDSRGVPIIGMCLMPNHVHLVIRPQDAYSLSRWAQWLFTAHTARHHACYDSTGHLWQGRFKIFAIQGDEHLVTVLRYVERNALRARLVTRAEEWRWSSLHWRDGVAAPIVLTRPPALLPRHWTRYVNEPQTAAELEAIRTCVNRQRPFGSDSWVGDAATRLGVKQSLIARGRPKKGSDPF